MKIPINLGAFADFLVGKQQNTKFFANFSLHLISFVL